MRQIIPEVTCADIKSGQAKQKVAEVKKRGCIVVRNVVPESKVSTSNQIKPSTVTHELMKDGGTQALEWLDSIKAYIKANPQVKGFPEDDKAVYEL
jgi:hypothetical protein